LIDIGYLYPYSEENKRRLSQVAQLPRKRKEPVLNIRTGTKRKEGPLKEKKGLSRIEKKHTSPKR